MSDLINRLRENADLDEMEHGNPDVVALEREAADEIERLREEAQGHINHITALSASMHKAERRVQELEDALRPFANDAAEWSHVTSDHRPKFWQAAGTPDDAKFTVGDLRRTAELLEGK